MSEPTPDVKSVFGKALELPSATERAAYLDAACVGHPALRAEVDALLQALDRAGDFLNAPPPDATRSHPDPNRTGSLPPATEKPGTIIAGRYKLLQQIGEGGMGAVWMADQTEPVKRRVAVKLIRADRGASRTILTRFEAERQAIALMNHPNIAKLLDAGTTEEGSPFFVMELVKGVPLTDYCDAHKLSVQDRLNLFRQICSAVHHAHQKGVIHRDLKPTNILVESHDGKPVPKVIDFGLAKATTGMQLTEHTLFTGFGNVMGTPLYMAPEQATFNAIDVDSRADIYALGVILYELLSGSTPIHRDTLKTAALDEMLRVIREQEPPPPSSRIGTTASQPSVAANRQSEPVKLGRFVRGELDWIVMKALAKERDRRYESATAFAADVERFLAHEPVTAGPPSQWYRLRKFVRRNKGRVVAAALVLFVLVAGIAGTSLGLVMANRATERAHAEEQKALTERDEKEKALDRERAGREAVQAALGSERQAAYDLTIPLAQQALQENDDARAADLLASCPTELRGWEWNFLSRLLDRGGVALRPAYINARWRSYGDTIYRFTPDARKVVQITRIPPGFHVQVWDTRTGERLFRWETRTDGKGTFCYYALDPAGRRLAFWDSPFPSLPSKAKQAKQPAPPADNDQFAVSCLDLESGTVRRLVGHTDWVSHVAFHPNGKQIASGSRDQTIRIWGAGDRPEVTLKGHNAANVFPLAFLPDKNQLLSVGRELATGEVPASPKFVPKPDELRVWDLGSQAIVLDTALTIGERTGIPAAPGVRLAPDGRHAIITDQELRNDVIDLSTGERPLALPRTHEAIGFAAGGTRALCYTADMVVCEVDIATGRTERQFRLPDSPNLPSIGVTSSTQVGGGRVKKNWVVALSPDDRWLALGNSRVLGHISVLDVTTGRVVKTVPLEGNRSSGAMALELSPEGTKILTADSTEAVIVWDVKRSWVAPEVFEFGPQQSVGGRSAVALSPDGRQLTVVAFNPPDAKGAPRTPRLQRLQQVDARTGQPLPGESQWFQDRIRDVVLSPDGARVAAVLESSVTVNPGPNAYAANKYTPVIFDRRTGEVLFLGNVSLHRRQSQGRTEPRIAPQVGFTPEGVFLCARYTPADEKSPAGRWVIEDVAAERVLLTIPDPTGRKLLLAPGGRSAALLGSETDSRAVEVWDLAAKAEKWHRPNDPAAPSIFDGLFSPDGQRLLTFALRPTVGGAGFVAASPLATVWNTGTGGEVSSFRPPARAGISTTQFTPDGERILSHDGNNDHAFAVLVNVRTGRQLLSLNDLDPTEKVTSGLFTADGRYLCTGFMPRGTSVVAALSCWDGSLHTTPRRAEDRVDDWLRRADHLLSGAAPSATAVDEALALTRRAVDQYPFEYDCWKAHGLAMLKAGKHQEALAALERLRGLLRGYPGVFKAQADYALAVTLTRLGRAAEARAAFDRGERIIREPFKGGDAWERADWSSIPAPTPVEVARADRLRAEAAAVLGVPLTPLPPDDVAKRIEIVEVLPALRLLRAAELVKRGEVAAAIRLTTEVTSKGDSSPGLIYNLACVYSLAAGAETDPTQATKYADEAMAQLRRAVDSGLVEHATKQGWNTSVPAKFREDTDLAPLRDRADFKALIADLEKRFQSLLPVAPPPREKK